VYVFVVGADDGPTLTEKLFLLTLKFLDPLHTLFLVLLLLQFDL
jgi:hypothetical protein